MKILIGGAGAVGVHLAKLLSRENHDIVLIDTDSEKLANLQNDFDLMTVNASPTSIAALEEAGAENAGLAVGVMENEASNITFCMFAHSLGARKTVARVDSPEYTSSRYDDFFKDIGIDSRIYPEALAAQEIVDSMKRSWIRQWWEVKGGALVLIGVKVRKGARILNIPLKNLCGPDAPYHVVAVKRRQETIIPHGDDELKSLDVVFFMTTQKYIPYIREISDKGEYPDVRTAIISGGGNTAKCVVDQMPDYMRVKIVERDPRRCAELTRQLDAGRHAMVIHGDGSDISLLQQEGMNTADAFLALTSNTESNILSCLAAKRMGVRKTIAIVENTDYIQMAESLDIGTIINKQTVAASHIYQMMLNADVTSVKCLTVSNADVAEFVVKKGSKVTRRPVKELALPSNINLGGLVRNGKGMLVNGNTQIQEGDEVVVFCIGNIQKTEKYFT